MSKPISRRNLLVTASGSALSGCLGSPHAPSAAAPGHPAAGARTPAPGRDKPLPPGLPDQIEHGPGDRDEVALTFHGQGDPGLATALLTAAEKAGARLTVLAVGTWLDAHPGMAERVLKGGHELGNHTQNHLDIGALEETAATAEIERCARRLEELTGSRGRWFRPSQTRLATPLVVRLARQAGYPHVLSYDVDSLDWTDPGPAAVRARLAGQARPGSVVSLHLGHPGTVAALPGILDDLHRRGLRAVTTSELLT
ncbi:polysaccharide deacetylase family protein [Streptomyces sp. HPF1205]|uniref:polysaccharide deacetylase family protein n=1 Tax=Streptomyces sp. HPF1205 TaxID=2873262 RepID=UPI001CEC6D7D|nr:polysaccharide deacetylase family protein [Streptomyces sp. HPF1205]